MIFEKLKSLIVDQLSVPESSITMDANFEEDLGADSLDVFELIMGLEEAFNIEIPEEDLEGMKTVGDVVNYLQRRLDL